MFAGGRLFCRQIMFCLSAILPAAILFGMNFWVGYSVPQHTFLGKSPRYQLKLLINVWMCGKQLRRFFLRLSRAL